jgi:hypothetical protein
MRGPWREASVDRALQTEAWPGHVANAGEAPHEGLSCFVRRDQRDVADIRAQQDGQWQGRQHRVPVGVDEARHQHPAPAVDDPGVRVERGFRGLDRLDPPAIDDNPQALQQHVGLAVEHERICERDAQGGGPRSAGGRAARAGGESAKCRAHGDGRRLAGEFLRKMCVQPGKRRSVAETTGKPWRLVVIRRADEHWCFLRN